MVRSRVLRFSHTRRVIVFLVLTRMLALYIQFIPCPLCSVSKGMRGQWSND